MSQMEYRTNFLFAIMIEIAYFCIKVLYAVVVHNIGVTINGITPDALLIFIGTYVILTGLYMTLFFINFISLSELIRSGGLDMYITKPVSLQFMVTLRRFDIGLAIPNVLGGVVMVAIGWSRVGVPVNFLNVIGYIGFLITGLMLTYGIFLIPQLLAFWSVRTNGVQEITNALWDFNNMPMGIYNIWIQRIGVFLLPIFAISNFSPKFILGKMSTGLLIWGIVSPILFLILSRIVFKIAVKRYTSASS